MEPEAQQKASEPKGKEFQSNDTGVHSNVALFFDKSQWATGAIGHAQSVAHAFNGRVVVLHVLVPPQDQIKPVDPVDWDIKRQQTRSWLTSIAHGMSKPGYETQSILLEGQPACQIKAHMAGRKGDIAAAMRLTDGDGARVSDTMSGVLASNSAAILIIPSAAPLPNSGAYRKILVPLDGSARAESALHLATTMAHAEDAELVLCYVPPQPGVTEFGVMDHAAAKLSSEVVKRNTQAGKTHLTKIKNSIAHLGLNVSTLIVSGSDERRSLLETTAAQAADIIVMATHGQSGHCDVPAGNVARFVLERSEVPVLLVRSETKQANGHTTGRVTSKGIRQPTGTDL